MLHVGCAALQTVPGIPKLPGTLTLPLPGCRGSSPACGDITLVVLQRVKGVPRVWKVKAELRERHDLPEELPEELVSLTNPAGCDNLAARPSSCRLGFDQTHLDCV